MFQSIKLSKLLAVAAWVSVLAESWLIVLRWIENDGITWGFLAFFFLVAVCAGGPQNNTVPVVRPPQGRQ